MEPQKSEEYDIEIGDIFYSMHTPQFIFFVTGIVKETDRYDRGYICLFPHKNGSYNKQYGEKWLRTMMTNHHWKHQKRK